MFKISYNISWLKCRDNIVSLGLWWIPTNFDYVWDDENICTICTQHLVNLCLILSLFLSPFILFTIPLSFFLPHLICPCSLTHHHSFSSQAGGPRHLLQDKPHRKHLNGFLIHLSPSLIPLHPSSISHGSAVPVSLLSADTEVFDPLDPQFPARWRCPYIYVQYGTCLVVYVYVRLLLACGPGLLSRSTTRYQSLEPLTPLPLLRNPSPHQPPPPHLLLLHENTLSSRTALLIPKCSMAHKLLLLHGSVCM